MKLIGTVLTLIALSNTAFCTEVALVEVKPPKFKQISAQEAEITVPGTGESQQKIAGHILDTKNNTINIAPDDICAVANLTEPTIICKSGKMIGNLGYVTVVTTGSKARPSYINHIGSYISEKPLPGMLGSGKRTFYCDGPCKEKEK